MTTFETECYWGYQSQVANKDRRGSEMDHRPHTLSASYHRLSQNRITTSSRILCLSTVHLNAYTPYARRKGTKQLDHNITLWLESKYKRTYNRVKSAKLLQARVTDPKYKAEAKINCSKQRDPTYGLRGLRQTTIAQHVSKMSQAATREPRTTRRRPRRNHPDYLDTHLQLNFKATLSTTYSARLIRATSSMFGTNGLSVELFCIKLVFI